MVVHPRFRIEFEIANDYGESHKFQESKAGIFLIKLITNKIQNY